MRCNCSLRARQTRPCCIRFQCAFSLLSFLIGSAWVSPENLFKTDVTFPPFSIFQAWGSLSLHMTHVADSSAVSFHSLFRLAGRLLSPLQDVLHLITVTGQS